MTPAIPRALVAEALGLSPEAADALPPGDLPIARFAERYLGYLRATYEAEKYADHPDFWTFGLLDELIVRDPAQAWVAILASLDICATAEEVALIAAGPLEDIIVQHGAGMIDRIEAQARRSPRFRYALTGVWPQGNAAAEVWKRVETARAGGADIDRGDPLPPA